MARPAPAMIRGPVMGPVLVMAAAVADYAPETVAPSKLRRTDQPMDLHLRPNVDILKTLGRRRGLDQVGFWKKLLEHPSYDAFWREQAVDRVSTVSSERGRAVKLSLSNGKLMLSVTNPDSGSATEELEVEYGSEPLDIGFNSRYLLDIAAQLDGEAAVLKLSDPGSPTLIQDRDSKGALYVLMPMRV